MNAYPQDLVELAETYKSKKSTASLAKWKPPIFMKLVEYTNFLPDDATCKQRLYHVEHQLFNVPKCPVCGAAVKWIQTYKPAQYAKFCSTACTSRSADTLNKRKATNIEKYGVESYSQTEDHKQNIKSIDSSVWEAANEKRKQTCTEKYGVAHVSGVDEFSEKRKSTNMEKFGHTNVLASEYVKGVKEKKYGVVGYTGVPEFKEKRKQTMVAKYGVKFNDGVLFEDKRKNTCTKKYGRDSWSQAHISPDTLNKLNDPTWLYDQHVTNKVPSTQLAIVLGVDKETINNYLVLAGLHRVRHASSFVERELSNLLTTHNISHDVNDRILLGGKELDIVIPSHKVAIEYCGLYWHSTAVSRTTPQYHKAKQVACSKLGYRLITIFEDEWVHNRSLVEQKVLAILGVDPRDAVFARKCNVVNVSNKDKATFFEANHIQGNGPGSLTYGLMESGVLVACMTFIKQKNETYILNRYATNCRVVGGFSKLLTHFKKNNVWKEIVSFADLRWSEGGVYDKNGFDLDKTLPPDYEYVDIRNIKRIHKFNFRHRNLPNILGSAYDPTLSETENTRAANWFKIYNCGLLRYVITNPK